MAPSMTIEGATDAAAFESYVEHFLVPSLEKGQVVVLDGLGAHRTDKVRELIELRRGPLVPAVSLAGPQPYRDLPTTMHLQTQTVLSLASKGCSGSWRW
jgi:transposase